MRSKSKNQLSFFDDPPPPPPFREVSQEIFLSWPDKLQYAYCARRDEDSAIEGGEFFLERAKMYWELYERTAA